MKKIMKTGINFMVGYNLIYLGVNYLWISYETMILPTQVSSLVPLASASFILGITASTGNAAGILGNLSAGYGGDKLIKNYGRRYLLIGTGIVGIFFSLLFESLTLSSLFQVIAGYVAIQGFSNLAIGAVQPVIAEISNESDRGTSAGINGFFSLMGSAMGFGITSIFLSSGYYNSAIYSLMIGISITGIGSAIVIDRYDRRNRSDGESTVTFKRINKAPNMRIFRLFSLGSFFVFSGITGLTYFELFFFKIVLKSSNPDLLVGVAGITVLAVSALSSFFCGPFLTQAWKVENTSDCCCRSCHTDPDHTRSYILFALFLYRIRFLIHIASHPSSLRRMYASPTGVLQIPVIRLPLIRHIYYSACLWTPPCISLTVYNLSYNCPINKGCTSLSFQETLPL